MKKIIVASIALLLIAPVCNQAAAETLTNTSTTQPLTPTTIDINSTWWQKPDRYEIAYIDGYREAYLSGEPIEFYVEGRSDKLGVNKENGFYVTAALQNLTTPSAYGAIVDFDAGRNAWKVTLTAPTDMAKQYKVSVHLLCGGGDDSPCAVAYAKGARLDKDLPFRFVDAVAQ